MKHIQKVAVIFSLVVIGWASVLSAQEKQKRPPILDRLNYLEMQVERLTRLLTDQAAKIKTQSEKIAVLEQENQSLKQETQRLQQMTNQTITAEKLADGAVTSSKQTIVAYHAGDNTFVRMRGDGNTTISTFRFDNVPAGDVVVMATLTAYIVPGGDDRGTVLLEAGGVELNRMHTHYHMLPYVRQLILHGRLANFSGGTLIVRIWGGGESPAVNIEFGTANDDERFGRRITVIAGL